MMIERKMQAVRKRSQSYGDELVAACSRHQPVAAANRIMQ